MGAFADRFGPQAAVASACFAALLIVVALGLASSSLRTLDARLAQQPEAAKPRFPMPPAGAPRSGLAAPR